MLAYKVLKFVNKSQLRPNKFSASMASITCQQTRFTSDLYEPDYLIVNKSQLRPNKFSASMASITCQQTRFTSDLYEPDYLISMEPDEPVYDCLNFQIKGYDFALLESYQSHLHKYANVMGINVEECWATPAQHLKVQRFKPGGTAVDSEYQLSVYERNVQVSDVPAWALGTLVRVACATLPAGCALRLHEHAPEHEEVRYVPDNQLLDLKQQLQGMGGARADNKKKK